MKKLKAHSALIIFVLLFIILRLPSIFEPHWYGDEGIYASVAYGIENGKKLYVDVFDNRLPAIYYIYSLGSTENRLVFVRILNIVAGIITLGGIYAIGRKLKLDYGVYFALAMAVWLLGTPKYEANIANNENFFIPFTIWGIWLILSPKRSFTFLSGVLFGISFLIKFPPLFTFFAAGGYVVLAYRNSLKELVQKLIILGVGFATPILIVFTLLFINGNMHQALEFGLLNNSKYVTYYTHQGVPAEVRTALTAFLILVTVGLTFFRYISAQIALLFLFLFCDFYAAIFAGRQYEHYLLQTVPSVSLVAGYLVSNFNDKSRRLIKLGYVVIFIIGINLGLYIFYQGAGTALRLNQIGYYWNFISYLSNKPITTRYVPFTFGEENEKLRRANALLVAYKTNSVYFYSNEAWVYDYIKVVPPIFFIPEYHQNLVPNGKDRLVKELEKVQPELIIVDKNQDITDQFARYLKEHYTKHNEDNIYIHYVRSI